MLVFQLCTTAIVTQHPSRALYHDQAEGSESGGLIIDSSIKLLVKLDMVEAVIYIACDRAVGATADGTQDNEARSSSERNFKFALELAKMACKSKVRFSL